MLAVRGIFIFAISQFRLALSIPFEWPSTASSFQLAFLWKCGRIPGPCPWCARAEESLASQAFQRVRVPLPRNWPAENFRRWEGAHAELLQFGGQPRTKPFHFADICLHRHAVLNGSFGGYQCAKIHRKGRHGAAHECKRFFAADDRAEPQRREASDL